MWLRWSRDSGSALCDTPQNGRSRTGWGGQKIGVMCTDGLKNIGIYETYIQHFNPESEVVFPTDELQSLVTKGICNAKNMNRYLPVTNAENPSHCFSTVCDWFEAQGCDTIIAGCTDIRKVFFPQITDKFNYIDSLEVLADSIISKTKK